jgi:hypothetical protein
MERVPIEGSSHIRSIGFENGMMEVEYTSGTTYRYSNITESEYQGILMAPSAGSALHAVIRSVDVTGERLPGKDLDEGIILQI